MKGLRQRNHLVPGNPQSSCTHQSSHAHTPTAYLLTHPNACCPSQGQATLWKVEKLVLALRLYAAALLRSRMPQLQLVQFNSVVVAPIARGPSQLSELVVAPTRPNATCSQLFVLPDSLMNASSGLILVNYFARENALG